MTDFSKVVHIGRNNEGQIFCKIKYKDKKLSISGVIAPKRNGDASSCGQIYDSLIDDDVIPNSKGCAWNNKSIVKFVRIWKKWHLNHAQAGSPRQTKYLEDNPITGGDYYTQACEALKEAGLNPDNDYIYNGKPYNYGHSWLPIEVPQNIVNYLHQLPDTDIQPAWV